LQHSFYFIAVVLTCAINAAIYVISAFNLFCTEKVVIQVRRLMAEYNGRGTPVAGVIVEPIQGEGGDNYASPEFFRGLQQICREVCECPQHLSYGF